MRICIYRHTYEPMSCASTHHPLSSTIPLILSCMAAFVMYAQFYHFNGFVIYLHATQTHIYTQHERVSVRDRGKEHVGCHLFMAPPKSI